jgi:hypothetical protein
MRESAFAFRKLSKPGGESIDCRHYGYNDRIGAKRRVRQGRQMLVRYRLLLALALTLSVALPGPAIAETAPAPLYQLRAYQLFEPSKALFHARFRDHAIAIMHRHGFDIAAIWEATRDGKPEFVYLLRWKNEAMMKAAWAAFMADPEWIAIKRETVSPDAPIMGGIEDRTMRPTDYSPPFQ